MQIACSPSSASTRGLEILDWQWSERVIPYWTEEAKRELIERGYNLTDVELRAHGVA